jgi:RNA recognition motif-containing protein
MPVSSPVPKPEPELEPEPELRRPVSPRPQQPLVEPEAAGATLWVGNIPDSLLRGSDGLKKTEAELRRVFFAHGVTTAVSVRKKPEGANKSWAFVSFATADGVQKAVMCSNFIACADGSRAELTVKVADIQAQIKKRASTPDSDRPPGGAMESMWNAQNKQVLQGLRTPMQEILETLHDIAATVPSVAAKIDQVTATLTSTEDLWSTEGSGDGKAVGSGSFKEVVDEDVKSYLLSHSNQQLHESNAYSQELMRRRYKESKARRGRTRKGPKKTLSSKAKSVDLVDDFAAKLVRVVPEIGDEARIELGQWEKKIDHWDFDIFRVNELTNGSPLAFVLYAVFSRYDLLNKLQLEER